MASDVRAYTAGSVYRILVKVGDRVERDQPIAVLESMKMEIPVEAPVSGTVTALVVTEGDVVDEDTLIAVIE